MDVAQYALERSTIMKYIDDKISAIQPFDPSKIYKRLDDLQASKEDIDAYDSVILGLTIGVGVLQAQCLAMDIFIGMASSAAAAANAIGATNSAAIIAL